MGGRAFIITNKFLTIYSPINEYHYKKNSICKSCMGMYIYTIISAYLPMAIYKPMTYVCSSMHVSHTIAICMKQRTKSCI